jgi:hypothetical protein
LERREAVYSRTDKVYRLLEVQLGIDSLDVLETFYVVIAALVVAIHNVTDGLCPNPRVHRCGR